MAKAINDVPLTLATYIYPTEENGFQPIICEDLACKSINKECLKNKKIFELGLKSMGMKDIDSELTKILFNLITNIKISTKLSDDEKNDNEKENVIKFKQFYKFFDGSKYNIRNKKKHLRAFTMSEYNNDGFSQLGTLSETTAEDHDDIDDIGDNLKDDVKTKLKLIR